MKLTKDQKRQLKADKQWLKSVEGYFLTNVNTGATALVVPAFKGSNMYHLSIANLHPNDEYSKKYGRMVVMDRFTTQDSIRVSAENLDILLSHDSWSW